MATPMQLEIRCSGAGFFGYDRSVWLRWILESDVSRSTCEVLRRTEHAHLGLFQTQLLNEKKPKGNLERFAAMRLNEHPATSTDLLHHCQVSVEGEQHTPQVYTAGCSLRPIAGRGSVSDLEVCVSEGKKKTLTDLTSLWDRPRFSVRL